MVTSEIKVCTKCDDAKPITEFYALGEGRIDSWCKICRKAARNKNYKSTKGSDDLKNYLKFSSKITEIELKELSVIYNRLEEIITHAKLKNRSGIQPSF